MASSVENLSLNKWYVTSPQDEARWNALCNVGLKTIALITCVAAVALAASVLVFAFLAASGTSMPIGLAVASFASFPLTHLASTLWNKSKKYLAIEQQENRVEQWRSFLASSYLKEDGTLNIEKINCDSLFREFSISVSEETLAAIQQHLPQQNPSLQQAGEAWLRVAARFMYELEITRKTLPEIPALDKNAPIERERAILRKHNYKEMHVYQHTLAVAMLSAIMSSPFIQAAHLSDLGSLNIKSKIIRQDDRKRFEQDDYFVPKDRNVKTIPVQGYLKSVARELTSVNLPKGKSPFYNSHIVEQGKGHFQNPDHNQVSIFKRENFTRDFLKNFKELMNSLVPGAYSESSYAP